MEVSLIDHMGSDLSVVNAARVSFGKRHSKFQEKDVKLINYLAKHNHKSPFNHAFATFHVKAPVFVARQLVKHEYMPWNEISRRYVDYEPEFYVPDNWRLKAENIKQGSSRDTLKYSITSALQFVAQTYNNLLSVGVAPEMARMVLPQNMMTEWYWSGSLFAFAKMCSLRLKEDTQEETRLVAQPINDSLSELYPVSWKALMENM